MIKPELVLEDPSEVHPFEEELDGDASAELRVPRALVAKVAHPLGQVLHQRQPASALLAAQNVGGGVKDENHRQMAGLWDSSSGKTSTKIYQTSFSTNLLRK